jgi:DNA modification methylase
MMAFFYDVFDQCGLAASDQRSKRASPAVPARIVFHTAGPEQEKDNEMSTKNGKMKDYRDFLNSKRLVYKTTGKTVERKSINPILFEFQRDLVWWSLRKGRAAIFADTGLGKTFMQLEWARLMGERTLIVAPLSVARQTANEGKKIGVDVHYTRSGDDLIDGINITNYEMIDHFDFAQFGAVVLDESSILKSLDGKMRQKLTDVCAETKYKLACTATPAPNDIAEIANHAEWLGIMSRAEMLAAFFVHDDNGWRLKGHAYQAFFRWMASWGMSVKKPSDLGYDDNGFNLPELTIIPHFIQSGYVPDGQLFFTGLKGITERARVRKETMLPKAQQVADLVNDSDEQWIIWHGLNDEGYILRDLVTDGVLVEGKQSIDQKIDTLEKFQDGEIRVLITKPSIAGFGMNFQNAHYMAFFGLNDSWESYYQAVRREWRFGQTKPVTVHVVLADVEQAIWNNVQSKEKEANQMSNELIKNVKQFERAEIRGIDDSEFEYREKDASGADWKLMLGDSVERIKELDDESVGLSVFSPPFQSLYTYSPSERDLGNSRNKTEFYEHFGYIIRDLLRITKPGRNACVHVQQLTTTKATDGYIGMRDFRGDVIRAFEANGWIYYGEVCIDKDPQAQAIRTHSIALLFTQFKKDSMMSRPALADYILIFKKPGDNEEPIQHDLDNETWIEWARPIWYGIKESDTLNVRVARSNEDERHICPLQLGTIERCIKLWSNEGDMVFSPFAGIGSEGYEALKWGRKFVGIELKPEYFKVAVKNLNEAQRQQGQIDLFTWAEMQETARESLPDEPRDTLRDLAEKASGK